MILFMTQKNVFKPQIPVSNTLQSKQYHQNYLIFEINVRIYLVENHKQIVYAMQPLISQSICIFLF